MTPEKKSNPENKDSEMKESETKKSNTKPTYKKNKNKKKNKHKNKKNEEENDVDYESKQKLLKICNDNEWVHLSCALWIAEVKIQKYDTKSDISDIENIDKKRFSETCSICRHSNNGVTEKCFKEGCTMKFHIECARINKYHLEIINIQDENKYVVYCEFHRPQRLMKNIEIRKQRSVEEIIAYSKVLEKCYEQVNSLKKGEPIKLSTNLSKKSIHRISLKTKYKKKDKEKIIRQVKNFAKEVSKFFVTLKIKKPKPVAVSQNGIIKKESSELINNNNIVNQTLLPEQENSQQEPTVNKENQNSFKEASYYEVVKKSSIKISYQDTLNPLIFPWHKIVVEGLTTKEIFAFYKKLVPSEYVFSKTILNKSMKKGEEVLINIINDKDNTTHIEKAVEDNNEYCYCRKKYSNEYMIGCVNEDNCVVGGWVHQECDPRLKLLSKEEISRIEFTCEECLKKANPANDCVMNEGNDYEKPLTETLQFDFVKEDEKDVLYFKMTENGNSHTKTNNNNKLETDGTYIKIVESESVEGKGKETNDDVMIFKMCQKNDKCNNEIQNSISHENENHNEKNDIVLKTEEENTDNRDKIFVSNQNIQTPF